MSLRDQPYLPLYVQDFLTDEKLIECSASATGVYIRIMCIMHKSEPYGVVLLKQKDKQTDNQIQNFALKLLRSLPYDLNTIIAGLKELISEGVLQLEGDELHQKRMIKDFAISEVRKQAGKKGGEKTQFAKAKIKANTENESDIITEDDIVLKGGMGEKELKSIFEIFRINYPGTKRGLEVEFENLKKKEKNWRDVVLILSDKLQYQNFMRNEKFKAGEFIPQWKNLQTWINQKCWDEEITLTGINNGTKNSKRNSGATNEELAGYFAGKYGTDRP